MGYNIFQSNKGGAAIDDDFFGFADVGMAVTCARHHLFQVSRFTQFEKVDFSTIIHTANQHLLKKTCRLLKMGVL